VRLAELRRRQGRPAEARALLDQAAGHPSAGVVRGALALDAGDAPAAAEAAERFLRRIGEADRFVRVPALELLVRARLAAGDPAAAAPAVAELEATAAAVGTPPLRAAALLARGRLEAVATAGGPARGAAPASGHGGPARGAALVPGHGGRLDVARAALEDAADLYEGSGARAEAAQARLELAGVLHALGRGPEAARAEAAARDTLRALGAPVPARAGRPADDPLTPREREVIRLLAAGRSNEAIARELVLSVRTVERHVENLYAKIGASGRTARATAAAWAVAHGHG